MNPRRTEWSPSSPIKDEEEKLCNAARSIRVGEVEGEGEGAGAGAGVFPRSGVVSAFHHPGGRVKALERSDEMRPWAEEENRRPEKIDPSIRKRVSVGFEIKIRLVF